MLFCGVYKPGVNSSQVILNTYESGIVALGTNQATATELTKVTNRVDTVGAADRGVRFPAALPGAKYTAQNYCGNGNNMKAYPATGENFLGLAANAATDVADGNEITVFCYNAGVWTFI